MRNGWLTSRMVCASQIRAFGLNRMDISQREGKYPAPPGSSTILGVEFSGTITQLGGSVSGWAVGDEVLGLAGGVSDGQILQLTRRLLNKAPL